jgi:hypothetical protein
VYTLSSFSITRPSFWTEGWRVCKRGFSRARHSCLIDTMDCWKKSLRKKNIFPAHYFSGGSFLDGIARRGRARRGWYKT